MLKTAQPVDVEDLGRRAAKAMWPPSARSKEEAAPEPPAEDEPGSARPDQLKSLHIILGGLGFATDDREAKLHLAETITGRDLGGTSKNLSYTEARKLTDTLDGFGGDREKLIAHMATLEQDGDGGD